MPESRKLAAILAADHEFLPERAFWYNLRNVRAPNIWTTNWNAFGVGRASFWGKDMPVSQ